MTWPQHYQRRLQALSDRMWQIDLHSLPSGLRRLLVAIRVLQAMWYDILSGQLSLRAMSLVYTTVIALVPLLALSFSVLKGLGAHNNLEPLLLSLMEPLGAKRFEIATQLIAFVDNVKVGVLGGVGFVVLVYSVFAMLQKIENAFNYIWRVKRGRPLLGRMSHYLSATVGAPLFLLSALATNAALSDNRVSSAIAGLPWVGAWLSQAGQWLLAYVWVALGFTCLYRLIPHARVQWRSALLAGVSAALAWKLMGWGVATFVANSDSSTAIYSAFASVILFFMWLYFGWLVVLLGASIAYHYQHPHAPAQRTGWRALNADLRIEVGCALMLMLAEGYARGQQGCSRREICVRLGIADGVADDLLSHLAMRAWVLAAQGDEQASPRYLPARPAEDLWLDELVRDLRAHPDTRLTGAGLQPYRARLEPRLSHASAQRVSLAQLQTEATPETPP